MTRYWVYRVIYLIPPTRPVKKAIYCIRTLFLPGTQHGADSYACCIDGCEYTKINCPTALLYYLTKPIKVASDYADKLQLKGDGMD